MIREKFCDNFVIKKKIIHTYIIEHKKFRPPECASSDWAEVVKINVIGKLGLKKLLTINILPSKIDFVCYQIIILNCNMLLQSDTTLFILSIFPN